MFEAIKRALASDYEHETPDVLRSKAFDRAYKSFIKAQIKPYGYELIKEKSSGYCESSGFITDNKGHYVYFNSGDYRYPGMCNDIYHSVLVRTAENEKDYRGGSNNFIELKDIAKEVDRLMKVKHCRF